MNDRELAGQRALVVHGELIAYAKQLCANENLQCNRYGCPEEYRTWIFDKSPASQIKFEAAKRVAQEYRSTLLRALRSAIGDELMAKLGEPEKYMYPQADPVTGVLAYCKLEFLKLNQNLFRGINMSIDSGFQRRTSHIILGDRNIEVSHTASFGIFDAGHGEQYIPGDLQIIVGVKVVDDVTSYYRPWRFQINPNAENFLKELFRLDQLPMRKSTPL